MLREAAELMRKRAGNAVVGPWRTEPERGPGQRLTGGGHVYSEHVRDVGEFADEVADTLDMSDAEHIASWHPAVALAVADWLDQWADHLSTCENGDYSCEIGAGSYSDGTCNDAALAVASAYLGAT